MTERALRPLTEEEYLALEGESPVRHELVGGIPYAMAGASLELLYPSTEAQDRREKLARYLRLASLEGYLLLESEGRGGTLYRRTAEGFLAEPLEESFALPCVEGRLSLAEVYEGVA